MPIPMYVYRNLKPRFRCAISQNCRHWYVAAECIVITIQVPNLICNCLRREGRAIILHIVWCRSILFAVCQTRALAIHVQRSTYQNIRNKRKKDWNAKFFNLVRMSKDPSGPTLSLPLLGYYHLAARHSNMRFAILHLHAAKALLNPPHKHNCYVFSHII